MDDCKNVDSIIVRIDPDLKPDVNFVADKTLVSTSNGLVSFKNLSQNSDVINYNWSFGNGDSSYEFESSYTYNSTGKFAVSLTAMSSIGCKSSLIKLDYIIVGSNKNVFLPNAITINDNELNNEFLPIGDGVKAWQLEVYDRRGFLLFEGNEVVGGFKGLDRNGVIVVDNVLIYKITITTIDSEKISIINNLTILR